MQRRSVLQVSVVSSSTGKADWWSADQITNTCTIVSFLILPTAPQRVFHLRRVAPHLQADENFHVAWIAAGVGGGHATLTQGRRKLRPLLFQLVTRALLVRQALPKRRIQAQPVAHFRRRTAAGFDVEGGDVVGDGQQQRGSEREKRRRWKHAGLPCSRTPAAQSKLCAEGKAPATHRPSRPAAGHSPLAQAGQRAPLHQIKASRSAVASPRKRRTLGAFGRTPCMACYRTGGEAGGLSFQLLSTA